MGTRIRKYLIPFPFLFSIYPMLTLIAFNISEMRLEDGFRALVYSFLIALFIYVLLSILIRDPVKSSLLTLLILILIFSYGHANELLFGKIIFGISIGWVKLGTFYFLILLIGALIILFSKFDFSMLPRFLNIITLALLIFPIYQIVDYQLRVNRAQKEVERDIYLESGVSQSMDQPVRDIYYIIADGYPRGDFIDEYMGMDNSQFLGLLESKGFYIAECSQANYTSTSGSMAATLNMDYLQNNELTQSGAVLPKPKLDALINSNDVQAIFSNLGYTIVTFDNGYPWLNWRQSEIRYDLAFEMSDLGLFTNPINDFEILSVKTTIAKLFLDLSILPELEQFNIPISDWDIPGVPRRNKVLFMFRKLLEIPDTIPSPKFVYFHVVFPHPPYILDADGNFIGDPPADELAAYADQIRYFNSRMEEIVDKILESSDPEPIIIIQSDHGASIDYKSLMIDKTNRLGILNALYLPGINAEEFYSTISPVNTFRLILDEYFNGSFGLLPDYSIVGEESPYITLDCLSAGER